MKEQEKYMRRALALAEQGMGYTSPNPMVGCVVVRDGRVISEGFHEHYGGFHAERNALLNSTEEVAGADLYVTLEPCCHYGKTPPCTEIIIEKKIRRVFVGVVDSNPLVGGKGIRQLRQAGIEVVTGILEEECRALNEVFFHYTENAMPFVAMKYAMTLDGKIACASGDSKWVTTEASRAYVQELRKRYTGILVGIETVLKDNPRLNCRIEPECSPTRLVCDSRLRIPLDSNLVKTAGDIPTYVACCGQYAQEPEEAQRFQRQKEALQKAGVHLVETTGKRVNLREFLKKMAEEKVDSILLEGGGELNASMLKEGLVNRVYAFIAPKLIGGRKALSPVAGEGVERMADASLLHQIQTCCWGDDFMITGLLKREGETGCSQD